MRTFFAEFVAIARRRSNSNGETRQVVRTSFRLIRPSVENGQHDAVSAGLHNRLDMFRHAAETC